MTTVIIDLLAVLLVLVAGINLYISAKNLKRAIRERDAILHDIITRKPVEGNLYVTDAPGDGPGPYRTIIHNDGFRMIQHGGHE